MIKFTLMLLILSSAFFANQSLTNESLDYCFLPKSQISFEGQLDFNALRNSEAQIIYNENYIYILGQQSIEDTISLLRTGDSVLIEFSSSDISYINSRLEYLNSLDVLLDEDAQSASPQIRSLENIPCRLVSSDSQPSVQPQIESMVVPPDSQRNSQDRVPMDSLTTKTSAQSEDAGRSSSLSLEHMLIPLILGAVSTLFLVIIAVHFRGNLFKPLHYPQELTIGKTQLEILEEIGDTQKIPTDIAMRVGKSKSTVIEHLEALKDMGVIERVSQPGRKFVYYRLTHSGRTLLLKKRSAA